MKHGGKKAHWKMLTWSNGNGTGETIERRYIGRASAIRAANRLRARGIVALVERLPRGKEGVAI